LADPESRCDERKDERIAQQSMLREVGFEVAVQDDKEEVGAVLANQITILKY
jgi:hypothetical protein